MTGCAALLCMLDIMVSGSQDETVPKLDDMVQQILKGQRRPPVASDAHERHKRMRA